MTCCFGWPRLKRREQVSTILQAVCGERIKLAVERREEPRWGEMSGPFGYSFPGHRPRGVLDQQHRRAGGGKTGQAAEVARPKFLRETVEVPQFGKFPQRRGLLLVESWKFGGHARTYSESIRPDTPGRTLPSPLSKRTLTFRNPLVDGPIYSISLQKTNEVTDGRMIIAGDFNTVNHVIRNRLARLLTNGVLDTTFDAGNGADGSIRATAMQPDGRLVIGGFFTQVANTNRNLGFTTYVIEDATRAIDLNGSLAAAWKQMTEAGVKRIQSGDIQVA